MASSDDHAAVRIYQRIGSAAIDLMDFSALVSGASDDTLRVLSQMFRYTAPDADAYKRDVAALRMVQWAAASRGLTL